MASNMNEDSIVKRTLVLTGKLVGLFSIWVALVSVVVTVAASRLVVAMSGSTAGERAVLPMDTAKKDDSAGARPNNPPVNSTHKPNG
jgi:hypothetical protein